MAKKSKLSLVFSKPEQKPEADSKVSAPEAPDGGWHGEDWHIATGQEHLSDHWKHGDPYQPDMRPKKPE